MKKLFCTLLVLIVSLNIYSREIEFEYNLEKQSKSVVFDYEGIHAKYRIKIKQEKTGGFSYHPVPFFQFEFGKTYFGELKIGRRGIRKPSVLSENPSYEGLLHRFGNLEFAVFSPVFASSSPYGVLLFYRHKNNYIQFLYENRSSSNSSAIPASWDVDWKNRKDSGKTFRTSVFINNKHVNSIVEFSANEFSGLHIESDLNLNYGNLFIRSFMANESEQEYSYTFGNRMKLRIKLSVSQGPEPVYGGQAQDASVSLYSELSFGNYTVSSVSQNIYEEDTGMNAFTLLGLSLNRLNCRAEIVFRYDRTQGKDNGFNFPDFRFHSDSVSFEIEQARGELIFSKTISVSNRKLTINFDQDRRLTVKTAITY